MDRIAGLLEDQAGTVSRRQLHAVGYQPSDIERMVRRRDLSPRAPGVYLRHTAEPTWLERAWLALLSASSRPDLGDVALAHWSALRVAEGPGRRGAAEGTIHVAIPIERRVRSRRPELVIHRTSRFASKVHPGMRPPRIRYEEALLDVALELPALDALGVLARAAGDRRSTAARILAVSETRARLPQRAWLEAVLGDIAEGTHSVLEHAFLDRVLRPHGMPIPRRQQREDTAIGVVYRDVAYGDLLIELDGRLHGEQRQADLDRDLQATVSGRRTVRLGWGQVVGRPCRTAAALAQLLGAGRPCGGRCAVPG